MGRGCGGGIRQVPKSGGNGDGKRILSRQGRNRDDHKLTGTGTGVVSEACPSPFQLSFLVISLH